MLRRPAGFLKRQPKFACLRLERRALGAFSLQRLQLGNTRRLPRFLAGLGLRRLGLARGLCRRLALLAGDGRLALLRGGFAGTFLAVDHEVDLPVPKGCLAGSVGHIAFLALDLLRRDRLLPKREAVLLPDAAYLLLALAPAPVIVVVIFRTASSRPAPGWRVDRCASTASSRDRAPAFACSVVGIAGSGGFCRNLIVRRRCVFEQKTPEWMARQIVGDVDCCLRWGWRDRRGWRLDLFPLDGLCLEVGRAVSLALGRKLRLRRLFRREKCLRRSFALLPPTCPFLPQTLAGGYLPRLLPLGATQPLLGGSPRLPLLVGPSALLLLPELLELPLLAVADALFVRHVLNEAQLLVPRLELLRRYGVFRRQPLQLCPKLPLALLAALRIMCFLVFGDPLAVVLLAGGVLLLPVPGAASRLLRGLRRGVQPEAVPLVYFPLALLVFRPPRFRGLPLGPALERLLVAVGFGEAVESALGHVHPVGVTIRLALIPMRLPVQALVVPHVAAVAVLLLRRPARDAQPEAVLRLDLVLLRPERQEPRWVEVAHRAVRRVYAVLLPHAPPPFPIDSTAR